MKLDGTALVETPAYVEISGEEVVRLRAKDTPSAIYVEIEGQPFWVPRRAVMRDEMDGILRVTPGCVLASEIRGRPPARKPMQAPRQKPDDEWGKWSTPA